MFHVPAHKQLAPAAAPGQSADHETADRFDHAVGRVAHLTDQSWGLVDSDRIAKDRAAAAEHAHLTELRRALALLIARTGATRGLFIAAMDMAAKAGPGFNCHIQHAYGTPRRADPDDVLVVLGDHYELRLNRDGLLGDLYAV